MGVTIKTSDGKIFGSLCAFDDKFYTYTLHDVEMLTSLAAFFENMLDLERTHRLWRAAEEERLKTLEQKSNLLAILSHEIRTPMNAILNVGEMLQSTVLTDTQQQYLHLIHSSGSSLMTLLNQILDYSKLDSGKMDVSREPFSLRGCLLDLTQLFRTEAHRKGIELHEIIPMNMPDLWIGDENKIRQILVNLLSNALKFTDSGEVRIEAYVSSGNEQERTDKRKPKQGSEDEAYLTFAVTDTGKGISADKQPMLFQAFTQLHTANYVNRYGGTGLGLSICKQLVELMGGRLRLEYSSGTGSRFVFSLPMTLPEASWGD